MTTIVGKTRISASISSLPNRAVNWLDSWAATVNQQPYDLIRPMCSRRRGIGQICGHSSMTMETLGRPLTIEFFVQCSTIDSTIDVAAPAAAPFDGETR